jgi:hypothetical protein
VAPAGPLLQRQHFEGAVFARKRFLTRDERSQRNKRRKEAKEAEEKKEAKEYLIGIF